MHFLCKYKPTDHYDTLLLYNKASLFLHYSQIQHLSALVTISLSTFHSTVHDEHYLSHFGNAAWVKIIGCGVSF
jgi:hypothetical protein